ncbi:PqiC family protein [Dyella lutea]|uniref:PqiC family protein n=1 Tax=Dyella lutea TaxID=2950441 RepID=A0ABT1FAR7_9GAMM|nr:PqiC family protein [Dyella lutea]MCP1374470.1 PqiC family protein [Dyella lutea]
MTRLRNLSGRLVALGAVLALGACASAPTHYYTLVPPASAAPEQGGSGPAFELLPVSIPAQDDQPQLVVRQGGQGVALLQGERWIAPLADEIRGALSAGIARALGHPDVSGLARQGQPVVRIKVDVRRFDSQPGGYALLEAGWSLRLLDGDGAPRSLACASRFNQPVGAGYDALVQGHQQALGRLADQIARAARDLEAGDARCPGG